MSGGSWQGASGGPPPSGSATTVSPRFVAAVLLGLTAVACALLFAFQWAASSADPVGAPTVERAQVAYGKLPLAFEANRGQTDQQVKFVNRGPGYTLFLTPREAVLSLTKRSAPPRGVRRRPPRVRAPTPRPPAPWCG